MRHASVGMILLAASLLPACGTTPEPSGEEQAVSRPATSSVKGSLTAADTYACLSSANDPVTGQKCPILTPCTAYADCGSQTGNQYWYCSTQTSLCQFLPQTNGFTAASGSCSGQLLLRQDTAAPYDKKIVPPDGVNFRQSTTLAIEVNNTTTTDLYLDQLPLTLEMAGTNPSRYDVNSIKMYQGGTRADSGESPSGQLVCTSPTTPFSSSANFTLGTGSTGGCGSSYFSRVPAGGMTRFILDLTFPASATYITDRQYRLKVGSLATGLKARTSTAKAATAYTGCGLPTTGMTGAYLIFANP